MRIFVSVVAAAAHGNAKWKSPWPRLRKPNRERSELTMTRSILSWKLKTLPSLPSLKRLPHRRRNGSGSNSFNNCHIAIGNSTERTEKLLVNLWNPWAWPKHCETETMTCFFRSLNMVALSSMALDPDIVTMTLRTLKTASLKSTYAPPRTRGVKLFNCATKLKARRGFDWIQLSLIGRSIGSNSAKPDSLFVKSKL